MVKAIPEGYTAITPYLVINDVQKTIDFLVASVDGKFLYAMPGPDGKPMHAEMTVGGAKIMMGAACEQQGRPPLPSMVYLYVPDCDASFAKAKAQPGTKVFMDITDQFYGDRSGTIQDANGVYWCISTHKEDLSPEQIGERMAKMMQQHKK